MFWLIGSFVTVYAQGFPQANPPEGTVPFGTPISLTTTEGNGTIYYTVDGSDPRNPMARIGAV
jgi:hypothetical protein